LFKRFFEWHRYKFCNYDIFGFKDKALQLEFNEWHSLAQRRQIIFITLLTASLYYLFTFIHNTIVTSEFSHIMTFWHLYVIPTMLLFTTYVAYLKKYCALMNASLMLATIMAAIANMHIVSNIEGYTTYQTELYLIIFWVFAVSGLRLIHSLSTGLLIVIISIVNSLVINPMLADAFVMHMFWMLASLSFGFLGAYLYEDANKKVFLNTKELQKSAITDNLTGLYNRRKFDETLLTEFEKTKRYHHSFGIIMMDIDHFKNVNDTYGHSTGDKVLMQVTDILKQNTRVTDILIRWGGEEFIVICYETNQDSIVKLAKKIRQAAELNSFEKVGKLTLSLGCTINKEDDDIDSITKRADKALYKVKNNGRNNVEIL
jgi:diguanylate cyclase (GGDEF)-like protein